MLLLLSRLDLRLRKEKELLQRHSVSKKKQRGRSKRVRWSKVVNKSHRKCQSLIRSQLVAVPPL